MDNREVIRQKGLHSVELEANQVRHGEVIWGSIERVGGVLTTTRALENLLTRDTQLRLWWEVDASGNCVWGV